MDGEAFHPNAILLLAFIAAIVFALIYYSFGE